MANELTNPPGAAVLDAVIVGAGFSGLYMLHRLRQEGLKAVVLEKAADVGGTWYWNRYPGARCDSDSIVYCFSDRFSKELLAEWEWSERYPSQPEVRGYLGWVADRLDLRPGIRFQTQVTSAAWDETAGRWDITTDSGERLSASFFIPAVGALSKPNVPNFQGLESFRGACYHSARFPEEGIDFAGKRVAVIGNGATGVQIVPEVAKTAAHVYAFMRHPYHCLPGRNHQLDADDWQEIHANHADIWEEARSNFIGFPYGDFIGVSTDFSSEARERIYEEKWRIGGFPAGVTFADLLVSKEANDTAMDFMRRKIKEIVRDPAVAEQVTPTEPFFTKRPPIEHGFYAAFNRDNVSIVDMKRSPVEEITPTGVRTADAHYEVDIILLATGFDAYTGGVLDLGIRGRDGQPLEAKWQDGPVDYLGLMVHGFPNMFMHYCGPYNPAILVNAPILIEQQGEWIVDCIGHLRERGLNRIEPEEEAERQFVELTQQTADATLIPETDSWWTGTNIEGKKRTLLSWVGGFPEYRRLCDEAAADGYAGFTLTSP